MYAISTRERGTEYVNLIRDRGEIPLTDAYSLSFSLSLVVKSVFIE